MSSLIVGDAEEEEVSEEVRAEDGPGGVTGAGSATDDDPVWLEIRQSVKKEVELSREEGVTDKVFLDAVAVSTTTVPAILLQTWSWGKWMPNMLSSTTRGCSGDTEPSSEEGPTESRVCPMLLLGSSYSTRKRRSELTRLGADTSESGEASSSTLNWSDSPESLLRDRNEMM